MIPQFEPLLDYEDIDNRMQDYFQNTKGWITEYQATKQLEEEIASFLGVNYCFMVNNGTISLSLALKAMGVQAGDRVIVPA